MSAPYRLSRLDFSHFRAQKRVSSPHVTVTIGLVAGRTCSGFATVVSKKVVRRAVERNRIKRRIRAIFRDLIHAIPDPFVCIVHAKTGAGRLSYHELRIEVEDLVRKMSMSTPGGSR